MGFSHFEATNWNHKADGKGTHKYFETILDIEYASEVAVKFSADPGWRIHGKQPNVNASGTWSVSRKVSVAP